MTRIMGAYLLARAFIDSDREDFDGEALRMTKSIERHISRSLVRVSVFFKSRLTETADRVERAVKNVEIRRHPPLLVGLYILSDLEDEITATIAFDMDFDAVHRLGDMVADEAGLTADELRACNELAETYIKEITDGE